jgi:hypothetical protein
MNFFKLSHIRLACILNNDVSVCDVIHSLVNNALGKLIISAVTKKGTFYA